ncbi:MAG TPA: oligosaccharide repeat unit polymerase [Gammaproteobacteria bacterium]|nr:oligosaccharide repeat unit polymerase [Gammaproteobacteria bacterium]
MYEFLLWLIWIVSCLAVIWISLRTKYDLLSPIWLITVFYVLGFIVRPVTIMTLGDGSFYDDWGFSRNETIKVMVLAELYGLLGYLCFYFGYRLKAARILSSKLPSLPDPSKSDLWTIVIILFSLVGFIAYSQYLIQIGASLTRFSISDIVVGARARTGMYYLQMASELFVIANLIWFVRLGKPRSFWLLHSIIAAIILLSFYARQYIFSYFLMLLVIYVYTSKKKISKSFLLISGMIAIAILAYMVKIRSYLYAGSSLGDATTEAFALYGSEESILLYFLFSGLTSYFDYFCLIISRAGSELDYQFGYLLKWLFEAPIPRQLLDDKLVVINRLVSIKLDEIRPDAPAISMLGDFYLNGHILGIIIGMVFSGVLMRAMYFYKNRSLGNLLIYALFMGSFFMIFRSHLGASLVSFLMKAFPVVLGAGFIYICRSICMRRHPKEL